MQLFFAVMLSIAIGALIFAAAFVLGNAFLNKTVYGHNHSSKMADIHYDDLCEYVDSEQITSENLDLLDAWYSRGEKVYLVLFDGSETVYESPIPGRAKNETVARMGDPNDEDPDNEYALTLSDGRELRAFLYYYASSTFYFWMLMLSGVLAFVSFSLCLLTLINRKVSYIRQLQSEIDILSGGQLDYQVTVNGEDELAALAAGIDEMRRSIINYQEIEKQMRSANSELITAMSHDLRTPLTSLLAYLEIIERKKYADEEQMYSLVHKSIAQTMRIKNMADKLFEYLMVYATDFDNADKESSDADELLSQMLGDYTYSLESRGMRIAADVSPLEGRLNVNTELLQRAFDNLYSNILKYADPKKDIGIVCRREDGKALIGISNGIISDREKHESTNIGLNTCKRIAEFHGGSFETFENDGIFTVNIRIPLEIEQ